MGGNAVAISNGATKSLPSLKRKNQSSVLSKSAKVAKTSCANSCPNPDLKCWLQLSESCTSSSTIEWLHLTPSEHCCSDCIGIATDVSNKGYKSWRQKWIYNGAKFPPSSSHYVADCELPYWLECTICKKWRSISKESKISPDLIRSFNCSSAQFKANSNSSKCQDSCKIPQSKEVLKALEYSWLNKVSVPCLLRDSPAAPFLGAYFPESVGLSPSSLNYRPIKYHKSPSKSKRKRHDANKPLYTNGDVVLSIAGLNSFLHPFYQPYEAGKALCVRPDIMEADERLEFPEFAHVENGKQSMYLGLRNLVIATWNLNPMEFVTPESCGQKLFVRGLIRVRCMQELERIIDFLTRKGTVNSGILRRNPLEKPLLPAFSTRRKVIVIGAGIAGLAAASQLHNFGVSVEVLEASNSIGGRICDHVFDNEVKKKIVSPCSLLTISCDAAFTVEDCNSSYRDKSETSSSGFASGSDSDLDGFMCQSSLKPAEPPTESGPDSITSFDQSSRVEGKPAHEQHCIKFVTSAASTVDVLSNGSSELVSDGFCEKEYHNEDCDTDCNSLDERTTHPSDSTNISKPIVVGMGASFVHGPMNNPISLMCHQLNLKLKRLRSDCHLYTETGEQIAQAMDRKVESHFNHLLEQVSKWNNSHTSATEYDASSYLFGKGKDAVPIWFKHVNHQDSETEVVASASSKLEPIQTVKCGGRRKIKRKLTSEKEGVVDLREEKVVTDYATNKTSTKQQPSSSHRISLGEKLEEIHNELSSKSLTLPFSELERRVLDFHAGNLEFACGSSLDQVCAINWDQNDEFPQFAGGHCSLPSGYYPIIEALSKSLQITKNCPVESIDYTKSESVCVKTRDGKSYEADKVIIAVPLTVLKNNAITFTPSLPSTKRRAIRHLGAGLVEKVALWFPKRFWERKIKSNQDYFGHIPQSQENRGLFNIFYIINSSWTRKRSKTKSKMSKFSSNNDCSSQCELTTCSSSNETVPSPLSACECCLTPSSSDCPENTENEKNLGGVLLTVVTGSSAEKIQKMTDRQVVNEAFTALTKMFPEQTIPYPEDYFVSRWADKEFINMSYSFVKCGSSGADYDVLSQPIEDRIFFAGECTHRAYPQTVTGAYLSGIREAANIVC